jgi:hypothetical protein
MLCLLKANCRFAFVHIIELGMSDLKFVPVGAARLYRREYHCCANGHSAAFPPKKRELGKAVSSPGQIDLYDAAAMTSTT